MKWKFVNWILILALLCTSCLQIKVKGHGSSEAVSMDDGSKYRTATNQSFNATDVTSIQGSTIGSDINVYGDATDKATVQVLVNGSGVDGLSSNELTDRINKFYELKLELSSTGQLTVSIKPRVDYIGASEGLSFEFNIHVLPHTMCELNTVSGDLNLEKLGTSILKTVSGDMDISGIDGNLSVNTTSGDITGRGLSSLSTAQTVSGDIKLDLLEVNQNISISSVSGGVELKIPPTSSASLDFSTVSGDVEAGAHAVQVQEKSERAFRGIIGKGEHEIKIHTVSGDLNLE